MNKPDDLKAPLTLTSESTAFELVREGIQTRLPPLTEEKRAAFRAEFGEALCVQWGAQTRSAAVQIEAERWVVTIFFTLQRVTELASYYSTERLSWLLEVLLALAAQRHEESQRRSIRPARRSDLDHLALIARTQRDELLGSLEQASAAHPQARDELTTALDAGRGDEPAEVLAGLTGLLALATRWLADPAGAAVLAGLGLEPGQLELAQQDADALRLLVAQQTPTGRGDSSATDALEGRLLLEMRYARDAFVRARAALPTVPSLVPGAGTKALLDA